MRSIILSLLLISIFYFNPSNLNAQNDCISGNCQSGYGVKNYPDGSTYSGEWENGSCNGYGKLTKPNGKSWEGNFNDGTLNGFGVYTDSSGIIMLGHWVAGKPDKLVFNEKSNPYNQFDNQGKPHGLWIMFFDIIWDELFFSGNPSHIKSIGKYNHGLKNGTWSYFEYVGKIKEENYLNGIKHGPWNEYRATSDDVSLPLIISNYKNGELDGIYQEYSHPMSGHHKLTHTCTYKSGVKNGEEIYYYHRYNEVGSKEKVINYKCSYLNGKLHGDMLFYNTKGVLTGKDHYEMGALTFSYRFN